MRLWTVGHGALAGEAFAGLLAAAGITTVVDVRRSPSSRRHPQFNRPHLAARLADAGIAYHWDEALGGRRAPQPDSPHVALADAALRGYADHMGTPAFGDAVARLAGLAAGQPVAVLCAEGDWRRCHRRLLADHVALAREVEVVHLRHDGGSEPHALTPGARRSAAGVVYDAGHTPRLPGTAT